MSIFMTDVLVYDEFLSSSNYHNTIIWLHQNNPPTQKPKSACVRLLCALPVSKAELESDLDRSKIKSSSAGGMFPSVTKSKTRSFRQD